MSLSFCMPLASALEMLSEFLDILPALHTVGVEFLVKRENGCMIGLEINLQCLLAEKVVNNYDKKLKRIPKQPQK